MVTALWGMLVARIVRLSGEADVSLLHRQNVFYRSFVLHERPFLIMLIVFAGAAWWRVVRAGRSNAAAERSTWSLARLVSAWPLALATLVVAAVGTRVVMHSIGL